MKHISESIIGRKGISGVSILRQGDIIITRGDDIYMVLTDQNCLKKVLQPKSFGMYDMSKGAYVHSTGYYNYTGFMDLSSFNDKLELENAGGSSVYDIFQVWRNPREQNTITSNDDIDDIIQIIQIENLKLLKKSYKLIWKR